MPQPDNIVWHPTKATAAQRERLFGQRPCVVWLTGLSGCGKSTIAMELEHQLLANGRAAYVLDGDNIRHGLNRDLGFGAAERAENIRRIGEVARLFVDAGLICIAAFISPYREDRQRARDLAGADRFMEVFVDVPLEVCERRDPKGLYKKARAAVDAGKGLSFTGIDAPYETPLNPELRLNASAMSLAECVAAILRHLTIAGFIAEAPPAEAIYQ